MSALLSSSGLGVKASASSRHTRHSCSTSPSLVVGCSASSSRQQPGASSSSSSTDASTPSTSRSNSSNCSRSRRQLLAGSGLATALVLMQAGAAQAEPFLQSTGARGPLVEEEASLYNLRKDLEANARQQLELEKEKLESEARQSQIGKLCATPFGIDVVGITELIALIGALVGGLVARQRKQEMEKLNEQLRTINMSLRQQARAGTVYAPGLTYAPSGGAPAPPAEQEQAPPRMPAVLTRPPPVLGQSATIALPNAATVATLANSQPAPVGSVSLLSMEEEEMSLDQVACRDALRAGKKLLREQAGAAAMVRFEKALMLSKAIGEKVQERRAMRGLAAAARLTKQYPLAIKHLERVLEISQEMQEYTGDADAYGTIADCYTDMGDFDKAAKFYDMYIDRMNREGPV